ncbi:ribosomal L7Ae/L30e/S12e/Gadd45 family protein [Caproiciproducens sp. MSJ-32]|uniref:ribosomal L7Ae/L30e/S12e/Gadd45 family protein n=1 Tax=Caproiciproducens sp. MSJ-32 TaxID=2841527 RepID=UPI001C0FA757|nr:ribosomal L7Ae/L30e/S12e/Gadd45 family protein [Caproiciproducens sp. MSJ-32]MBU5455785.1 ribosomal L7Ae/L30e/S12e/Gadd45 family protein [Caproiciproducens sp. MSJ-32]
MNKFFNFLGLAKRSGNLIEGYSKCDEQRNRKNISLFIISKDASESTKKKFINHCKIKNIDFIEDFTKEELGTSIGREEVKILAVTDENMAKKLYTLYEEEK